MQVLLLLYEAVWLTAFQRAKAHTEPSHQTMANARVVA